MGTLGYADTTIGDGKVFSFVVHKYGNTIATTTLCDNVGAVFNPLQDPHDPATETRGTIDAVTVDTD